MKTVKEDYHFGEEDSIHTTPQWLTLFISLMLVLLTLFIFLTTFAKGDKRKIESFKREFRKSLMLPGEGNKGQLSIVDMGTPDDPVRQMITRMKSNGINKKLMDDFLTLQQIKDLEVRDGSRGVSIIVPEVIAFEDDREGLTLTPASEKFLNSVSYLAAELPYLIEIKGYAAGKRPAGYTDALEFSARRAQRIYEFMLGLGVPALKLKVSGCGDAFSDSGVPQNKVEIIFQSTDL
jgi:flagellar motor protein MotB